MEWLWDARYKLRRPIRVIEDLIKDLNDGSRYEQSVEQETSLFRPPVETMTPSALRSLVAEIIINIGHDKIPEFRNYHNWEVIDSIIEGPLNGWRVWAVAQHEPRLKLVVVAFSLICDHDEESIKLFNKISKGESGRRLIDMAATFVQAVMRRADAKKLDSLTKFVICGHELGGVLAQIAYLSATSLSIADNNFESSRGNYFAFECICFDSPGCRRIIDALSGNYGIDIDELPPPSINVTAPNLLNTFGSHWGNMYRIYPEGETESFVHHPFDESLLKTTITSMNSIFQYLQSNYSSIIIDVIEWPVITCLDYSDPDLVEILGRKLIQEQVNEEALGIDFIEQFIAAQKNKKCNIDNNTSCKRYLQNVYIRICNSRWLNLERLIGAEPAKQLIISDPVKKILKNTLDYNSEFVLCLLPNYFKFQCRTYNIVFDFKSLQSVISIFLGEGIYFSVSSYDNNDNESCIAILKNDRNGIIMLSGLKSSHVDRFLANNDRVDINQLLITSSETKNPFCKLNTIQGCNIFEYLCHSYDTSSILWLHARKNKILLKCFYDERLRINRKYGSENYNIKDLIKGYDTILIYGDAGSGKTNEIQNIMNKINSWVIYLRIMECTVNDVTELHKAFSDKNMRYLAQHFFLYRQVTEDLIKIVLEKCLYSRNAQTGFRVLICFDGMDLLKPEVNSGDHLLKQSVMKLLLFLKRETQAQLIITARRRTDYLREIEKQLLNQFPSQKLWKGEMQKLNVDEMRDNIARDISVVRLSDLEFSKDETNTEDLLPAVSDIMSRYQSDDSNAINLEVSLACLTDFSTEIRRKISDLFSLIVDKGVKNVLMMDKVKHPEIDIINSYIYSLKQYIFNKFQSLENKNATSKQPGKDDDAFITVWKNYSDCVLEFVYIQTYLDGLFGRRYIENPLGSIWQRMMCLEEYFGLRALLNEILLDNNVVLSISSHKMLNNEVKRKILFKLIEEKRINIIRFFSQIFTDSFLNGENAIHIAAKLGDEELADIFISLGNKMISERLENGNTALHIAAMNNHARVAAKLLNAGANCGDRDSKGNTALHIAVQNKSLFIVEEILKKRKDLISDGNKVGETALHLAARCGAEEILVYLLDQGADTEQLSVEGFTPFLTATKYDQLEILKILLSRGACSKVKSGCGFTSIHYAAGNNSFDIIKYLVNEIDRTSLHWRTNQNFTALHVASANGCLDAVKHLIDLGADVNAVDSAGRSSLHFAASMGRLEIVKYLVKENSSINLPCLRGYTPLHLAAKNGRHVVVDYLLNKGADPSSVNYANLTPIKSAANNTLYKTHYKAMLFDTIRVLLENKNFNVKSETSLLSFGLRQNINFPNWITELLIERTEVDSEKTKEGFQSVHFAAYSGDLITIEKLRNKITFNQDQILNSKSSRGYTPLYISVALKSDKEMTTLLQLGADCTICDENGITPFHLACYYGKLTMVDTLAERNKSLANQLTNNYSSPLHLAADSGYYDVISHLVEKYDASMLVVDSKNYSCLHIAAFYGRLHIIKFIIDNIRDFGFVNKLTLEGSSPLNLATSRGKNEVVKFLLEKCGANPEVADNKGFTPLHNAVYRDHSKIVLHLLKSNEFNCLNLKNVWASTPLFIAVKQRSLKSIPILLDNGADVNLGNENGFTPIHLASLLGEAEILRTLINHNGDVNVQDKVGRTPLFLAAMKGHKLAVQVLIEKTADVTKAQIKGWTPLHVAAYESRQDIVKLLGIYGGPECVNLRTNSGDLALHFAAWKGNIDLIRWLIEHGTDKSTENEFKITPTDLAVSQNFAHPQKCSETKCQKCYLYNYLWENGIKLQFMKDFVNMNRIEYEVVRYGCLKAVEYLETELKANFLNHLSKSKQTPIHAAAVFERTEILRYFYKRGWDLNAVIPVLNETPLYVAVVEDKLGSVKCLVELGADLEIGDRNGWTPLHAAVFKNHAHMVNYLCSTGKCNIDAKTNYDMTPLYIGVQYNCMEAVEMLVSYRPDPTIADKGGYDPLRVAELNLDQQLKEKHHGVNLNLNTFTLTTKMYSLIMEYWKSWEENRSARRSISAP